MRYDANQKKLHQIKLIRKDNNLLYIYKILLCFFDFFYIWGGKYLIIKYLDGRGGGRKKSVAACRAEGIGKDLSISFEIGC